MKIIRVNGATSNLLRFKLRSGLNGNGLTGLTGSTTGLIISARCDNEQNGVQYTAAGSTIQTIATIGTFAAPSVSNCRFGAVDATSEPGVYELQLLDTRFSVSSAKILYISVIGAANLLDGYGAVQLTATSVDDGVHGGMTALPNTACTTNASLLTSGSGTDQLTVVSGVASSDAKKINAVSTSSVTTVNANVGTTQAITFDGNNFQKVDVQDWLGTTVATPATGGIPDVNTKNINNVATTSVTAINANMGTTQPTNFSGIGSTAYVKADTEQLNSQAVTAATGVTFPATVASPTNITAGTMTTVTNLTNAPTAGDFTSTMKTSLNAATPSANVASINSVSTSSVTTVNAVIGLAGGQVSAIPSSGTIPITTTHMPIDWSAVANPTSTVGLTGTTISTSQSIASVSGSVASVSGNVGGNVIGTVASVLGNVSGNVVGSVGSVATTVNSYVTGFVTTAITETTPGWIAAAFRKFFNLASPTSTMNEITLVDTTTAVTNNVNTNANSTETTILAQTQPSAIRAGIGLANANLDTQFTAIPYQLFIAGPVNKLTVNADGTVNVDTVNNSVTVGDYASGEDPRSQLGMASANLDTQLAEILAAASEGSGGSGPYAITITVTDGTNPIQSATVGMFINASRYVRTTNNVGVTVLSPTEGSGDYAVRIVATGYQFTPATLPVSGNTSHTYAMTQITISGSTPPLTTGYLYCYDQNMQPIEGVPHTRRLTSSPSNDTGSSLNNSAVVTVNSDINGLVTFMNHLVGASYQVIRNSNNPGAVTYPALGYTFKIPDPVGP